MTRATTPDEVALQAWCALVLTPLGYDTVLFDDQRSPEVIPPWASSRRLSEGSTATLERRTVLDPGSDKITVTLRDRLRGTVRVIITGGDHATAARYLKTSLRKEAVRALNKAAGLAILGLVAPVLPIGTASGGVPSARTVLDCEYHWIFDDADAPTDQYVKAVRLEETFL